MELFGTIVYYILFVLLFGTVVMAIRNQIVYKVRTKAADYVFSQDNWKQLMEKLDEKTYNQQMWDLKKWKFEHFYPAEWNTERIEK